MFEYMDLLCIIWCQWHLVLDQGWQLHSSMGQLSSRHSIGVKQAVIVCGTGGSQDLNSRGAVTAAHLARCSSWQALPVSREWLGWRRPNQACCNLHLIDECMESVETPIRNKTLAGKDLGCAVSLTLCLLNITGKTWEGWQFKGIQKISSVCIHSSTWIALWCLRCFAMWIAKCLFCKKFPYINLKWKCAFQVKVEI